MIYFKRSILFFILILFLLNLSFAFNLEINANLDSYYAVPNHSYFFFANYTNNDIFLSSKLCNITFSDGNSYIMNEEIDIYQINRSFSEQGYYSYFINCENEINKSSEIYVYNLTPESLWYFNYSKNNFGLENESYALNFFGNSLKFVESSFWQYISENSTAIGFETNLPSKSYIEYGEDINYSFKTQVTSTYNFFHLKHLRDLKGETLYHYRLVVESESGDKIYSEDKNFTTIKYLNPIYVPQNLSGPKFYLTKNNGIYVLTEDIVVDAGAFYINANNIILDLNGHNIIYDNGEPVIYNSSFIWADYYYNSESSFGIKSNTNYVYNISIFNGNIMQGKNRGRGSIGLGFGPICISPSSSSEVAGVNMIYSGDDTSGLVFYYGGGRVHHNVILDDGKKVSDRHLGLKTLYIGGSNSDIYNNLILRARHQAIVFNANSGTNSFVRNNEIYVDSFATNSFGILPIKDLDVINNKIFGYGYHFVGIGWNALVNIFNNFVFLRGEEPLNRDEEYGAMSSVNGMRLTQYGGSEKELYNNSYENNLVIGYAKNGTENLRGFELATDTYVRDLNFNNNTIKVEVLDDKTGFLMSSRVASIVGQGLLERAEEAYPIEYKNSKIISNIANVRFGDSYTQGSNHDFINTTFVKTGNNSKYHTFWFDGNYFSKYHDILDCSFEGGAAPDDVCWALTKDDSYYRVGWFLKLNTSLNSNIIVKDLNNNLEFLTSTDSSSNIIKIPIIEYEVRPVGWNDSSNDLHYMDSRHEKIMKNPHRIIIYNSTHRTEFEYNITGKGEYYVAYPNESLGEGVLPIATVSNEYNNSKLRTWEEIRINGNVDDIDGYIEKTIFYVNNKSIGESTDSNNPNLDYIFSKEGFYEIKIEAIDNENLSSFSSPIFVNVSDEIINSYWDFNSFDGNTLNDNWGELDGVIYGANWTTGKFGQALYFDGVNDYVVLPKNNLTEHQREVTILMWVKPFRDINNNVDNVDTFYSEHLNEYWEFALTTNHFHTRNKLNGPYGARLTIGAPEFILNQWQHIALVYSVNNSFQGLYWNGTLFSSSSNVFSEISTGRSLVTLGKGPQGEGSYFKGLIDELYFFNRALSLDEIKFIMNIDNFSNVSPVWSPMPENQKTYLNQSFEYKVNAIGFPSISYNINDTDNFKIDSNGIIQNNSILSIGNYSLEINASDGQSSILSIINIEVKLPPKFIHSSIEANIKDISALFRFNISTPVNLSFSYWNSTFNQTINKNFISDKHSISLFNLSPSSIYSYNFSLCNSYGCNSSNLSTFKTKKIYVEYNETYWNGNITRFNELNETDLLNLSNVILERNYAQIKYLKPIKINRSLNLSGRVIIEPNRVMVNSSSLPELNCSAEITFYNLNYLNPKILKNGEICSSCYIINYSNGTLRFNVTSFSEYIVEDNLFCGDGVCNNGETCSICSSDCGSCSSSSSSGGGGGSSSRSSSSSSTYIPPVVDTGKCVENWICSDWGSCEDNIRSRVCIDGNKCTVISKKTEEESCGLINSKDDLRDTSYNQSLNGSSNENLINGQVTVDENDLKIEQSLWFNFKSAILKPSFLISYLVIFISILLIIGLIIKFKHSRQKYQINEKFVKEYGKKLELVYPKEYVDKYLNSVKKIKNYANLHPSKDLDELKSELVKTGWSEKFIDNVFIEKR